MWNHAAPWHSAPFLRIVLPFLGGIACAPTIGLPATLTVTGSFVLLAVLFGFCCGALRTGYSLRWIPGLVIHILIAVIGLLRFQHQPISSTSAWVGHHLKTNSLLVVYPESIPVPGKKSDRLILCVSAFSDPGRPQLSAARGKLLIYIPKGLGSQFIPGEYWLIPSKNLKPIRYPNNPGSFNFASYYARQQILYQAFLNQKDFIKLPGIRPKWLPYFLARGQLSAIGAIRNSVSPNNQGLAMALLIGYRGETDKLLLQAYTNTGVVHVIAVSGMHLGLLFLLLQKIWIFPDKKQKLLRGFKVALVLLIIWWFSGIAGFSPSISRAALMFSLVTASGQLRKPLAPLQTICFTAFILLWFEPGWLTDAGFQLSFAAILGILYYQPLIKDWLSFNNPLLSELWKLCATTIAAQLLTLPVCIYLFHQAPVYFLFTNLIAIPLSSIALITILVQWILYATGIPIILPGNLTDLLLGWLNQVILHFNRLPGTVIQQITWTASQTALCYILLIGCGWWLTSRSRAALFTAVTALVAFCGIQSLKARALKQQQIVLVLHLPGKQQSAFVNGDTIWYFRPPETIPAPVLPDLQRHFGIRSANTKQARFFRNGRFSIALPQRWQEMKNLLTLKPVYLLIPPGTRSLSSIYPQVSPATILILDGSIPEKLAAAWSRQLRAKKIRFYNTWESGALLVSMN